jgi:predicted acylesterase/phospholipase RssA
MTEKPATLSADENLHPVRLLPSDPPLAQPTPGMALCLSGGGYRAMLFHLGTIWRLNELGLLKGLKRISSVSGGSITAGVLGLAWKNLINWGYAVCDAAIRRQSIPQRHCPTAFPIRPPA